MRFQEVGNRTVRFGTVSTYSKSHGAVRCCEISYGAVLHFAKSFRVFVPPTRAPHPYVISTAPVIGMPPVPVPVSASLSPYRPQRVYPCVFVYPPPPFKPRCVCNVFYFSFPPPPHLSTHYAVPFGPPPCTILYTLGWRRLATTL